MGFGLSLHAQPQEEAFMKRISNQTLLKGSLFLVLAANMTWAPFKLMHSDDMASGASDSIPAAATAASVPVAASTSAANGLTVDPAHPAEAAAKVQIQDVHVHNLAGQICGQAYEVALTEKQEGEESYTKVIAHSPGRTDVVLREQNNLAYWKSAPHDREMQDLIKIAVAKKYPDGCKAVVTQPAPPVGPQRVADTTTPAAAVTTPSKTEAEIAAEKREEEAKDLADKVKNCEIDAKSHAILKESARFSCNLISLERLAKPPLNADLKKERAEILKDIFDRLKRDIKDLLMSSDENHVRDAKSRVEDAIKSLKIGAKGIDFDYRDTNKMVNELTAMKNGVDSRLRTIALTERTHDLHEKMDAAWNDYHDLDEKLQEQIDRTVENNPMLASNPQLLAQYTQNMHNQMQYQPAYQNMVRLFLQNSQARSELDSEYRNIRGMSGVSIEDRREFSTPLDQLKQDLAAMADPSQSGGGSLNYAPVNPFKPASSLINTNGQPIAMPADGAAIRAAIAQRFGTSGLPSLPTARPMLTMSPMTNFVTPQMGTMGFSGITNPATMQLSAPSALFNQQSLQQNFAFSPGFRRVN
jgi:hypothetical protein